MRAENAHCPGSRIFRSNKARLDAALFGLANYFAQFVTNAAEFDLIIAVRHDQNTALRSGVITRFLVR
jgi:hypothetical protein